MARQEKPIRWKTLLALLVVALGLGALYRFVDLGKRPMHTDEAILAIKTQEYWKTGRFAYDPHDYHGPFLHHLTRWAGGFAGWTPDTLTEPQLRRVTAVCGLLLLLTPLLFLDVIGRTGAGVAAMLLAVSPMMSYYSRYYIMETPFVLLVALFLALMWQWAKRKNKLWLLPAGVLLGLMHATKETFVLNVAAIIAGCGVVKLMGLKFEINERGYGFRSFTRRPKPWWAWVMFGAAALLASTWMFSNGFRDWQYVTDSFRTYESYLGRSQGGGGHEKPWHYYLSLIFWRQQGFLWSQALIGGLAIVGMLNAFLDRRRADHKHAFLVGLSTYTLVLLTIYSVIPYKTPWSVMGVVYALALLAGLGTRAIFRVFTDVPAIKAVLALALAGGIYNLCHQTSFATDYSFPGETRYATSETHNPYAYSHTAPNLVALSERIHELADKSPTGKAMPVQVIQSESGWPLPWYLRDMTHVGYQTSIPDKLDADAVVVDADKDSEVLKKLGEGWETSVWGLRSGLTVSLLVKQHPGKARVKIPEPEIAGPPAPTEAPTAEAPKLEAAAPTGTPAPTPPAPMQAAPAEPAVPKAVLVEDEPPLTGPPFPVPPPRPPQN